MPFITEPSRAAISLRACDTGKRRDPAENYPVSLVVDPVTLPSCFGTLSISIDSVGSIITEAPTHAKKEPADNYRWYASDSLSVL